MKPSLCFAELKIQLEFNVNLSESLIISDRREESCSRVLPQVLC